MPQGKTRESTPFTRGVASIIQRICDERGLTQTQVGEFLGTSQGQARRLLNSEKAMTLRELNLICRGLGVRTSDIIAEAESRLAVLETQDAFTLAASVREPDPYEGLGEESQDV